MFGATIESTLFPQLFRQLEWFTYQVVKYHDIFNTGRVWTQVSYFLNDLAPIYLLAFCLSQSNGPSDSYSEAVFTLTQSWSSSIMHKVLSPQPPALGHDILLHTACIISIGKPSQDCSLPINPGYVGILLIFQSPLLFLYYKNEDLQNVVTLFIFLVSKTTRLWGLETWQFYLGIPKSWHK